MVQLTSIGRQQIFPCYLPIPSILLILDVYADPICPLQNLTGDPRTDQIGGRRVFTHLVDRQDTIDDHIRLRVCELREDETGTIAQRDLVG